MNTSTPFIRAENNHGEEAQLDKAADSGPNDLTETSHAALPTQYPRGPSVLPTGEGSTKFPQAPSPVQTSLSVEPDPHIAVSKPVSNPGGAPVYRPTSQDSVPEHVGPPSNLPETFKASDCWGRK